jgi:hypothetical protein
MGLRHVATGALAVAIAGAAGMAYLLYQRRGAADLFGYYPEKFSWLMAVLLGVVGITLLSSLLVRRPLVGRAARAVLATLAVAAAVVALVFSGLSAPERISPAIGILAGRVFGVGNVDSDAVFREVNESRKPDIRKTAPDYRTEWINYYVGYFAANAVSGG